MTLKKGSTGSDVSELQKLLNSKGCDPEIETDGIFGQKTEDAVKQFQRRAGLLVDGLAGPKTMKMIRGEDLIERKSEDHLLPPVLQRFRDLGFKVFEKPFMMNIFGIRRKDGVPDQFDDLLGVAYRNELDQWVVRYWKGTTDAGLYFLHKISNPKGCAILVEDRQYLECYKIGLHRSKYRAMVQRCGKVAVYRDRNKDSIHDHDPETIQEGWYGINLHRSTTNPDKPAERVHRFSAGCQVWSDVKGFNEFMKLADLQVEKTGEEKFTYTLLSQW